MKKIQKQYHTIFTIKFKNLSLVSEVNTVKMITQETEQQLNQRSHLKYISDLFALSVNKLNTKNITVS